MNLPEYLGRQKEVEEEFKEATEA
jgi:hypothetical protein